MGFGSSKQQSQSQSQQTSESKNQAYPFLSGALMPQVAWASRGTNAIADLLGLNGANAQTQGFDTFRNSSGYNFIRDQGLDAINSNNASKGLLASGSALKAITGYGQNLASTFLDSYLNRLSGITNQGNTAAQILSGAGNTANSQGTSVSNSSGSSKSFSLG